MLVHTTWVSVDEPLWCVHTKLKEKIRILGLCVSKGNLQIF